MRQINSDYMTALFAQMIKEENLVRSKAQKEYAREDNNVLANFDRIGKMLKCQSCKKEIGPYIVLMTFFLKHIDGILSFVEGNEQQREPIEGRIKDARVYLMLLRAMIEREKERE